MSNYWKEKTNNSYYWDQQNNIRKDILEKQAIEEKQRLSELDKYKNAEIDKVKQEVRDYENSHGFSGNFW